MISEPQLESLVRMALFMREHKDEGSGPKPPVDGTRDSNQWNITMFDPGAEVRFEERVRIVMERLKEELDVR